MKTIFEALVYFSYSLDTLFITPLMLQPYKARPLNGSLCSHLNTTAVTLTAQHLQTPLEFHLLDPLTDNIEQIIFSVISTYIIPSLIQDFDL